MIPLEVTKAIERIVKAGANAKVSQDKKGQWHVFEEKVKKVPIGHPQP
ncbi:hypothetical protein LJC49_04530 [Ruminococcaceae bacterium OttesenSCG-928-I18]|nr:hypothetical protein [Ruminococcaceae bacterium OttesenSCG-928-I18]